MVRSKRIAVAAVAIGALSVAGAAPVRASSSAATCRMMGPNYLEGAVGCVCLVAATISDTPLPDVHVCESA